MYRAFWIRKAVTGAIDHLLDGKEGDEHAADRDRYIERRHRSHRRHAQALKAIEIIQVTEIDHAKRDREHHAAIEQFEEQPLSSAQKSGCPRARVTMSASTTTLKPVMAIPHRIIRTFSSGSSKRHFKWRCSCNTNPSNCVIGKLGSFREAKAGYGFQFLSNKR